VKGSHRFPRKTPSCTSLLITIAIALCFLATSLATTPGTSPTPSAAAAATQSQADADESDWPQFRGDASHTGYTNATIPDNPALRWVFEVPRAGYENFSYYSSSGPCGPDVGYFNVGSPVVSQGVVIFHAIGWPCAMIRSGTEEAILRLYALNASTGKHLWNWSVETMIYHASNPIIINDTVIIGEGRYIYGFDIITGTKIWQTKKIDYFTPSFITPIDGQFYLGKSNSFLYNQTTHFSAFSLDGDLHWNIDNRAFGASPPIRISNEQILVPLPIFNNETTLLTINNKLGNIIDNNSINVRLDSNSVVYEDYLYGQRIDYQDNLQQITCFDIGNNKVKWLYNISNPEKNSYLSYPSYALDFAMDWNNSILIVNGIDSIIRGLDSDGEMVWSFSVAEGPSATALSSPSIASDRVIFGGYNGRIYMLNVTTGDEIWSYLPKYPSPPDRSVDTRFTVSGRFEVIETSPAIVNDWFFIATKDGKIYAFGPPIENTNNDALPSIGLLLGITIFIAAIAINIFFRKNRKEGGKYVQESRFAAD